LDPHDCRPVATRRVHERKSVVGRQNAKEYLDENSVVFDVFGNLGIVCVSGLRRSLTEMRLK